MISLSRKRYAPVPVDLDDANLAKHLTRDLGATDDGIFPLSSMSNLVPDDKLASESGNDWHAIRTSLYFGYRESTTVIGKEIRRISSMPFSDKVLTRDGDEVLTPNTLKLIRRFSEKFVDSGNIHIHDGPFGCMFKYSENREVPIVVGDRPLPYFYSRGAPSIKGRLFHIARTSVAGRVINFVKLGGNSLVPEELREHVLYLLPADEDWCTEVITRFLPLDWRPSRHVSSGHGKSLYVFPGFFATTNRERSFHEDMRNCKGSKIVSTVLEVRNGVVESLDLDEKLYHPDVIEMVHEAAGKRVLIYRPIQEAEDQDLVCRKVLKRIKRYDQLLGKINGSWPKTAKALTSCLSISMTELILAGIYHPDVRERFPELYCFLERRVECLRGERKGSSECDPDDTLVLRACPNTRNARKTRNPVTFAEEQEGIPIELLMTQFYRYSSATKSYYAINRPVDNPAAVFCDGEVFHFTESNAPIAVHCTPHGVIACGKLTSTS